VRGPAIWEGANLMMKAIIGRFAVCFLCLAFVAQGELTVPVFAREARVTEIVAVYDAGTFTCRTDVQLPVFGRYVPVKVRSISLPKAGESAADSGGREFTERLLEQAKFVALKNIERDGYFRVRADVYLDGVSLADLLVDAKAAVPLKKKVGSPESVPTAKVSKTLPRTAHRKQAKPVWLAAPTEFARSARRAAGVDVLGQLVDLSAFTPEMPLDEAIEVLKNATQPALRIVVLWNDLSNNAFIERDSPIGLDAMSGVSVETALELLLGGVSAGGEQLDYALRSGIIVIATKGYLGGKMVTRTYDLALPIGRGSDFFLEPVIGGYGRDGGGGLGDRYGTGGGGTDRTSRSGYGSSRRQGGGSIRR